MADIPNLARAFWDQYKDTKKAAFELEKLALRDPDVLAALTQDTLPSLCLLAIKRVQSTVKRKYSPEIINTTIEQENPQKQQVTPAFGRPRIVSPLLTFVVNGKALGDATKADIFKHIEERTKSIRTEIHNHIWFKAIAARLDDVQTVKDVWTDEELAEAKQQSTTTGVDLDEYTLENVAAA